MYAHSKSCNISKFNVIATSDAYVNMWRCYYHNHNKYEQSALGLAGGASGEDLFWSSKTGLARFHHTKAGRLVRIESAFICDLRKCKINIHPFDKKRLFKKAPFK